MAAALVLGLAALGLQALPGAAAGSGSDPPGGAGLAIPPGLADGSPAVRLADLPAGAADPFAGAAMVDVGGGCSAVLVRPIADPPPAAPAYVLTNGHCVDMLAATDVLRDAPGGGEVQFGWPRARLHEGARVVAIPWASMKDTDLAILELDRTLADLRAAGVPAYPIAASPAAAGTRVAIVGAPAPDDDSPRQLTVAVCTLLPPVALVEDVWSWSGFSANRCAGIRHGSSGSPVLDVTTGELVGLVNTGTDGSEGRSDCMFDRPCEVTADAAASVEDAVYGPSVAGIGACWDATGRFAGPGGGCPLDPGIGLRVDGATQVTNPSGIRPDGRRPRTTWGAHLATDDPALAWYRVKTGPLGVVDCHEPAGYGAPVRLADTPLFNAPLPDVEGRYQLCLLAGPTPVVDGRWQEPRFATVVTAWVDKTPPLPAVEVSLTALTGGWAVGPIVVPPELETFTWKAGPAPVTDCTDGADYRIWRHAPIRIDALGGPVRLCLVGHDPAGNPSPPLDRVLPARPGPTASPAVTAAVGPRAVA